ncbi:MAG: TonB-dependent receptor [Hyphomonadaceae bacterium JAD_PAG50586_4]|nr:MAG: TonB-dependent receptor [Hyphomonadaceae bacterium JAD_PAG50586_4]
MTVTPGRSYGEETEDFGASGELNWDIGGMNFTSITAFRDWSATRSQDVDFSAADIAYRDGLEIGIETLTQEFRLQGENGPVNWLVGLFYGNEEIDTTDRIRLGAQAIAYTNTATIANTAPSFGAPGCELVNTNGAVPSLFTCFNQAFIPAGPARVAMQAAINAVNGGHLLPSAPAEGQQQDNWNIETQSISLFTHNEIELSERLLLTVGARYNQDTKDLTADLNATNSTCDSLVDMEVGTSGIIGATGIVTAIQNASPGLATLLTLSCNPAVNPIANGNWEGNREENEFSGTASLSYRLSDDVMLYGGYSRGYKAGGFNVDRSGFTMTPALISNATLSTSQLEFEPEFTDAYEIGLKTTILGGTTTANVAAFFQQIHDYQSNNFNGFNFITENVPEVISQGVELEISSRPIDGLMLNAGVVYTDAYYDSEVRFNPSTVALGDNDPNAIFAGQPLSGAGAAEWTVTGGVAYEMPIGADMNALFYVDGRWNSGYRTQTLARNPVSDNDAFAIFNGRVSLRANNERWSFDIWGQNLTDEFYYVGAFQPPLLDTTVIYPNAPRTWGVTARLQY